MPTLSGSDIGIKIVSDADVKGFKEAEKRIAGFSKKTVDASKLVAKAMLGIGVAVGAGLGISIKRAADFETRLSDISTLLAGDSTQAVNQFKEGILAMTKEVPVSADELGASAYAIVSAGISDTSEALNVLKISAKLATAGLGSTEESTDLLTSAINAFAPSGLKADDAANILFKTVRAGKTTVGELAQAFGQVAPLASALGVDFDELQAATAALTTSGLKTSVAQTQLRAAMVALTKPTDEMKTLLKGIGAESGEAAIKQFGFVGTMKKVSKEAKGNNEVLGKAFGSVEALNSVLALTGPQGKAFEDTLEGMRDGTDALSDGFEKQKETFANSFQLLKNTVDAMAISVGSRLLPPLADFARMLAESLGPAIDSVIKFLSENEQVLIGLAAVLATMVTPAFVAWGIAAAGAAASTLAGLLPLIAAGLVVAGIALLLYDAWNENFLGIRDIVNTVVTFLVNEVFPKVADALAGLVGKFKDLTKWVSDNKDKIRIAAGVIMAVFLPALVWLTIQAGLAALSMAAVKTMSLVLGGARVIGALARFAVAGWSALGPWAFVAVGVLALVAAVALLTNELEKLGLISERFNVLKQIKAMPGFIGKGIRGELVEGTDFAAPGTYLVGEKGPELVNLPEGTSVTPTEKIGGITVHQTNIINNPTDMDAAMRELGWRLST